MNIATTSLNAMGDQHDIIHGNTQDSRWLREIVRFAPFAIEWYSDTLGSSWGYGKTSEQTTEFPKSGDLLRNVVAHFVVNPLTSATLGPAPSLVEFFPYLIFNQIRITLGGQRLIELRGVDMAVIYMLQTEDDLHLDYAIGAGSLATRQYRATKQQEFLAPFTPFLWFSAFVLPVIALGKTNISLKWTTAAYTDVVQYPGGAAPTTADTTSGSFHQAQLLYEYIFVTQEEQLNWQRYDHEYAVQVWQNQTFSATSAQFASGAEVNHELVFSNPVTELIVWSRLDSRVETAGAHDPLNFTGADATNSLQLHPFSALDLRYSNNGFQWAYSPAFCEKLMPYLHHSRVPRGTAKVYVIPFADRPESWYQLSTATDFTQIFKVIFRVTLTTSTQTGGSTVNVLARCINRFRVSNKTGGLMWS
jgi:hypothetical protein